MMVDGFTVYGFAPYISRTVNYHNLHFAGSRSKPQQGICKALQEMRFWQVNIVALIIRIGFGGALYYTDNKEPPQNRVSNYLRPYIITEPFYRSLIKPSKESFRRTPLLNLGPYALSYCKTEPPRRPSLGFVVQVLPWLEPDLCLIRAFTVRLFRV